MFRFSGLQCELLRVGVFLAMSWSSPELLFIMVFPSLSLLLGSIAQSGLVSPRTLMEALYMLWLATVVLGHSFYSAFKSSLPLVLC
jgi:hypothetical protein